MYTKKAYKYLNSLKQKSSLPIPRDKKKYNPLKNKKGMATLETVPLLVVFIVLMTYGMGLWGSVHSAILTSMAARSYAFETMRNRSALYHFRETVPTDHYAEHNFRYHAVRSTTEENQEAEFLASRSQISFKDFRINNEHKASDEQPDLHATITSPTSGFSRTVNSVEAYRVSPVWIMIGYGYCLTLGCQAP